MPDWGSRSLQSAAELELDDLLSAKIKATKYMFVNRNQVSKQIADKMTPKDSRVFANRRYHHNDMP